MPRTRKPIKVKEPIRLRTKELANGSKSFYLDRIDTKRLDRANRLVINSLR